MRITNVFLFVLSLYVVSGCALLDGVTGDNEGECAPTEGLDFCNNGQDDDCDGDRDCDDTDCFDAPACAPDCSDLALGTADVNMSLNTCGYTQDFSGLNECGPPESGDDLVMSFTTQDEGFYEICHSGLFGQFFLSQGCSDITNHDWCIPTQGCQVIDLAGQTDYYLVFQGNGCGNIDIQVKFIDGETGNECDDGMDNDNNGQTDCEEQSCQISGNCNTDYSIEFCNGIDDGDTGTWFFGYVDEMACGCRNDNGCDDIGSGYICHDQMPNPRGGGGGVCAPACQMPAFDFCGEFQAFCDTGSGRCIPYASTSEDCALVDGVDNDGDGLIDCEDDDCWFSTMCDTNITTMESCNGINDGTVGGFSSSAIDELACRCYDWKGCDNMNTGESYSNICHTAPSQGPLCAPPCNEFDWCSIIGATCDSGSGECF